jgi:hypothetical protein
MDPKKIAEEIVKDLFEVEEIVEEKEEGEEEEAEEEGDEDAGEEEEEAGEEENDEEEADEAEDKAPVAKAVGNAMKGSATTQAAASISLKGQLPPAAKSSDVAHDALGGGTKDAHGGGQQMTQPTGGNPGALAATLNMKPSYIQGAKMTAEEVNTDITAIFGSQELTEEFAKNAASIYEAAVTAKVEAITTALVEQFEEKLVEEVETVKTALVEQLDNYLAYVVQEWAKENKVAIENGLRTEIAEDFMNGLKNLFAESYVEVPNDKVNLFDELSEAVQTLEGRINEEIEKNVGLTKELSLLTAQKVFAEETRNLTVLQTEKVREIAENLEYEGEEDFRAKVQNLVEGVTSKVAKPAAKSTKNVNEQIALMEKVSEDADEQEETLTPLMELYSKTINRTLNS